MIVTLKSLGTDYDHNSSISLNRKNSISFGLFPFAIDLFEFNFD